MVHSSFTPILLGVTGGSGSGKTTLARRIKEVLTTETSTVQQDSYYKDQSKNFTGDGSVNFDHPEALDFDSMHNNLLDLKKGHSTMIPKYCMKTHKRLPEGQKVVPTPIIIVDGTLILAVEAIRNLLDYSIFLDISEDIRLTRRIRRDTVERGRSEEGIRTQWREHVAPMHHKFVQPSKKWASWCFDLEKDPENFLQEVIQKIHLKN